MNITYGMCKKCKDVMFSFNRHNIYQCKCHSSVLDGGFDYIKCTGSILTKVDTISNLIPLIREKFIWGRNYDKDNNRLAKTEYILLKDLATDHIINILIYFTLRLRPTVDIKDPQSVLSREWIANHLIFLEELKYRQNDK